MSFCVFQVPTSPYSLCYNSVFWNILLYINTTYFICQIYFILDVDCVILCYRVIFHAVALGCLCDAPKLLDMKFDAHNFDYTPAKCILKAMVGVSNILGPCKSAAISADVQITVM